MYSNGDKLFCMAFSHPKAHLYGVHPSSDGGEGSGVSEVVHGQDAVSFAVVLLRDAAEPGKK